MWSPGPPSSTMTITSFSPNAAQAPGDAIGSINLTITGSGFPNPALVWLYWQNEPVIKATDVVVQGTNLITATLDLSGWTGPKSFTVGVSSSDLQNAISAATLFTLS